MAFSTRIIEFLGQPIRFRPGSFTNVDQTASTPAAERVSRNNNVGFMRFFLAMTVVIGHLGEFASQKSGTGIHPFQFYFPAVPGFIALSGYLITQSMERSRGYGHFLWKRLLRVLPAFVLSIAFALTFNEHSLRMLGPTLLHWATFGIKGNSVNGAFWSLSVEEALYALLALWFFFGVYANKKFAVLFFIALSLTAVPLNRFIMSPTHYQLLAHTQFRGVDQDLPYLTWRALDPLYFFVAGSLFYVARAKLAWAPGVALVAGIMLLGNRVFPNSFFTFVDAQPWVYYIIAWIILSLALYAPPVMAWWEKRLGDASYGIYVYHLPILYFLAKQGFAGWWLIAGTIAGTSAMAFASWHLIEKRALAFKDRLWFRKKRPAEPVNEPGSGPLQPSPAVSGERA